MFKLIAATFATILAVASGAAKPGFIGAPVAYSAPLVAGAPVVSAYGALPAVAHAPVVSAYSAPYLSAAPLAYSAHRPVAYLG